MLSYKDWKLVNENCNLGLVTTPTVGICGNAQTKGEDELLAEMKKKMAETKAKMKKKMGLDDEEDSLEGGDNKKVNAGDPDNHDRDEDLPDEDGEEGDMVDKTPESRREAKRKDVDGGSPQRKDDDDDSGDAREMFMKKKMKKGDEGTDKKASPKGDKPIDTGVKPGEDNVAKAQEKFNKELPGKDDNKDNKKSKKDNTKNEDENEWMNSVRSMLVPDFAANLSKNWDGVPLGEEQPAEGQEGEPKPGEVGYAPTGRIGSL
jgi:hypothetical protein